MQYNPAVTDRSADYMMMAAQTQANMMSDLGQNIGGALASIGDLYAKNRALEAEADGYDKIGEILGGSMFKDNPAVSQMLGDLRKTKDKKAKLFGYKALFDMTGPISNAMNTQNRIGYQQQQPFISAAATQAKAAAGGQATVPPQSFSNINFGIVD